jgi:hypothetical protein
MLGRARQGLDQPGFARLDHGQGRAIVEGSPDRLGLAVEELGEGGEVGGKVGHASLAFRSRSRRVKACWYEGWCSHSVKSPM